MRGYKLFREIQPGEATTATHRKGRNDSLLARRNECLVARYYYYGHVKDRTYEDTLRLLVTEFFVTTATVINQVQENVVCLQALKNKRPSLNYFTARWPHLRW